MPLHHFKTPGLIRAGFQYQDLVAIEVLIDFYRQRNLYDWVQLDSEDSSFRSIDDVVACTPDGLFELTQVKFTAAPQIEANALSWEWLIGKSGAGRSLLEKWADTTLRHSEAGTLKKAALKTDRIPNAAFGNCLNGSRVSYSKIPREMRQKIEIQLGTSKRSRSFFKVFEFLHSLPHLSDLEEKLWARIASDTDRGGWALFRDQVQRWSTRRGEPKPDGKVRYIHLRQAFASERPQPIPQGFLVPPGYQVPNSSFDRQFLNAVASLDGTTVLWGSPGRGKSTYLSHCVARLARRGAVCLRHHYFLSLNDSSEGRFHYHAIFRSLQYQLSQVVAGFEKHNDLRSLLMDAAATFASTSRRLVVIVDGLDHVWREHRDREDMEELFNSLLPLPSNVHLIVGTQKIAETNLPRRLVTESPLDAWVELPLMSEAAVRHWLEEQDTVGRLRLDVPTHQKREDSRRILGRALHETSQGLPLHLIYSFEALTRTGRPISPTDVELLPACPTGNIEDYYRSLWSRVSEKARVVLHALAGLAFGPPPSSLYDCFGRTDESLVAFAEISHLLDLGEMEVRPFHTSLFAFARSLPDHDKLFNVHARQVLSWLENAAPLYWKRTWTWITQSQLGNPSELLDGPSQQWAIEFLVSGYPVKQLVTILSYAERAALTKFDLPRLIELRCLKTRVLNAPQFQTDNWRMIAEVAVSLSGDEYAQGILRNNLVDAAPDLFPFIVRSSASSIRHRTTDECLAELNRRVISADSENSNIDTPRVNARNLCAVAANLDVDHATRVLSFANRSSDFADMVTHYTRESLLIGAIDNVLAVGRKATSESIDRDVLAALCIEGLAPSTRPTLRARSHPAIRCLENILNGGKPARSKRKKNFNYLFELHRDGEVRYVEGTSTALYEIFFTAMAAAIVTKSPYHKVRIPAEGEGLWLADAVDAFESLADQVSRLWTDSSRLPLLSEVYSFFALQRPVSTSYDVHRQFMSVRLALRDIAIDLCCISMAMAPTNKIREPAISEATNSSFWSDDLWLDAFVSRRLNLHAAPAAEGLVNRMATHLDHHVTEFNERADLAAKLSLFALDHDLVSLAQSELKRSIASLLGYGWRKDMFASEVVQSLKLLVDRGDEAARSAFLRIAGEIEAITDYTDRDETPYIREEYYRAVVELFPERIGACYAHLIARGEWRFAEVIATEFAARAESHSTAGTALLATYIDRAEILALEQLRSDALQLNEEVLITLRRKAGRVDPVRILRRVPGAAELIDSDSSETTQSLATTFPPGHLSEYLDAVPQEQRYAANSKIVKAWLEYWVQQGRTDDALRDVEAFDTSRAHGPEVERAYDTAFDVALSAQGRSKALPWLIKAHVAHHGWHRWFTDEATALARFKLFATNYPGQWDHFINATSRSSRFSSRSESTIVIGLSRLVSFLVEVGEVTLAGACAQAMMEVFVEEVRSQPVKAPEWAS